MAARFIHSLIKHGVLYAYRVNPSRNIATMPSRTFLVSRHGDATAAKAAAQRYLDFWRTKCVPQSDAKAFFDRSSHKHSSRNSTGVIGVAVHKVAGELNGYRSMCVIEGKRTTKLFSIARYGNTGALTAAAKHRRHFCGLAIEV